jgi:hypothetical protein
MKWLPPKKLKVLTILFFGAGVWGMAVGMLIIKPLEFMIVVVGVMNFCIGGFLGYRLLTQGPKPETSSEKRKK